MKFKFSSRWEVPGHMTNFCRSERKIWEKKIIFFSQIFFSRIVGVYGGDESLRSLSCTGGATLDSGGSSFYSFQTTATYNGIDWKETGDKTSSGSGGTSDAFSASSDNVSFTTPFSNPDGSPASTSGSASTSGANTTSYDYTEQAFLDDNGTWQIGQLPSTSGGGAGGEGGSSAGEGSFTAGGWQDWSFSGSSAFSASAYGNWDSGTLSTSGSGSDSYGYTEYYNFRPGGQWSATSGTGTASGNGSITSGYAVSGGYGSIDPAWLYASGTVPTAIALGSDWSGKEKVPATEFDKAGQFR